VAAACVKPPDLPFSVFEAGNNGCASGANLLLTADAAVDDLVWPFVGTGLTHTLQ
jgi:uncharacterized membrane protein